VSRRRVGRVARDAFGASLLDMMCCGLGAAIVVFVLRQMEIDRQVESAETEATELREDAVRQVDDAVAAKGEAVRLTGEAINSLARADAIERDADRIGVEIRNRQRATVFGLPPIKGHLSVLIDRSGSMGRSDKIGIALQCVRNVVFESTLIDRLRIASFAMGPGAEGHRVHFDGDPGPPGTEARRGKIERLLDEVEEAITPANGTDLVAAIERELTWIADQGGGTILLATDGLQSHEISGTRDLVRAFRVRSPGKDLRIHSIGLFQAQDGIGSLRVESVLQPGFNLVELANETGGAFVGIPVNMR
jgi:hypothetical protein